jgi:hypothetical protein
MTVIRTKFLWLTVMIYLAFCIEKHKKLKFATATYISEHVIFLETDLENYIWFTFCLAPCQRIKILSVLCRRQHYSCERWGSHHSVAEDSSLL